MMEENNDISLAGSNALVYLAGPMHKKYSTTFVFGAIHLVRTHLSTDGKLLQGNMRNKIRHKKAIFCGSGQSFS